MSSERGRGKPPWIPTPEIMAEVEKLASRGMTKQQIADCLDISYQTLNEKSKEYDDFAEAIKRGKAKGISHVTNKLLENVDNANVTAQIFYLKCQAKWQEKDAMDLNIVHHEKWIDELK